MTAGPEPQPRVALVSGASRGIGLAIAGALIGDGWRVSLGMREPVLPAGIEPAAAEAVAYDASDPGAEAAWVEKVLGRHGRIDAIVANAGIIDPSPITAADERDVEALLNVNVRAPRRLAAAAWPALAASGRGRIVIIASLSGKRVKSRHSGLYSVSKFAAVGLAHALRHEGWDSGIRATAVCPGLVNTDMGRGVAAGGFEPGAMTQPDDLARLIVAVINQPNTLGVAELAVNCQLDGLF